MKYAVLVPVNNGLETLLEQPPAAGKPYHDTSQAVKRPLPEVSFEQKKTKGNKASFPSLSSVNNLLRVYPLVGSEEE